MNAPDIENLLVEPDPVVRQAELTEIAVFAIGFVIAASIFILTGCALNSLLMSKASAKGKVFWVIIILALPLVGACLFYDLRKRLPRNSTGWPSADQEAAG